MAVITTRHYQSQVWWIRWCSRWVIQFGIQMSCNYRVIKLTLLMTCKLALKSIPNHWNNYKATPTMIDSFLFAYKIAGDVLPYFSIISICHNSLFNKYCWIFVPGAVLSTSILWCIKQAKKKMLAHMNLTWKHTINNISKLYIMLYCHKCYK